MNEEGTNQIVSCGKCGARNRVRLNSGRTPVCGHCGQTLVVAAPTGPITVTDLNFAEVVERSKLPFLLDLWAPWCGPCRMVAPIVDEIARVTVGRAGVGKLNVDENQATAARFNVQGIPTLLIIQNGWEVDRIVGVESKESILRRLERFMSP